MRLWPRNSLTFSSREVTSASLRRVLTRVSQLNNPTPGPDPILFPIRSIRNYPYVLPTNLVLSTATKSVNRGNAELIVLAGDTTPLAIVMHLPVRKRSSTCSFQNETNIPIAALRGQERPLRFRPQQDCSRTCLWCQPSYHCCQHQLERCQRPGSPNPPNQDQGGAPCHLRTYFRCTREYPGLF